MTTPSNLKSEALSVLAEIPHTFITLSNADSNYDARARLHFITCLRQIHSDIAECFGEPRPTNIGVLAIADDLTRWVSVWVWHPYAERWVSQLRHINHVGSEAS